MLGKDNIFTELKTDSPKYLDGLNGPDGLHRKRLLLDGLRHTHPSADRNGQVDRGEPVVAHALLQVATLSVHQLLLLQLQLLKLQLLLLLTGVIVIKRFLLCHRQRASIS